MPGSLIFENMASRSRSSIGDFASFLRVESKYGVSGTRSQGGQNDGQSKT
jgi:hypothetical protein